MPNNENLKLFVNMVEDNDRSTSILHTTTHSDKHMILSGGGGWAVVRGLDKVIHFF